MAIRIKNWKEFQHYSNRSPAWIKLYCRLLNDLEWLTLSYHDRGCLQMLWLIAAQDKKKEGNLPDVKGLAYLMRLPEKDVTSLLTRLSHWVYQDADIVLATCYQDASNLLSPEEKRREDIYTANSHANDLQTPKAPPPSVSDGDGFDKFWEAYPRKIGKVPSKEKYIKLVKQYPSQDLIDAAAEYAQDCIRLGKEEKYILHPSTFLNKDRWKDYCFAQLPMPVEGNK